MTPNPTRKYSYSFHFLKILIIVRVYGQKPIARPQFRKSTMTFSRQEGSATVQGREPAMSSAGNRATVQGREAEDVVSNGR